MAKRLHDISPLIGSKLAVFPGDTPPTREVLLDRQRGDPVTLSTLRSTVHVGAHVDAESHYAVDGLTIEHEPLDRFVGRCHVARLDCAPGERIGVAHFEVAPPCARLLIATGSYPDPTRFESGFAALAPDLIDWLAEHGVRLIGVDTPSVDPPDSKGLPAHARCFVRDVRILEGLVLDGVPAGDYELIALPLRLEGFDASPVRAVLREL